MANDQIRDREKIGRVEVFIGRARAQSMAGSRFPLDNLARHVVLACAISCRDSVVERDHEVGRHSSRVFFSPGVFASFRSEQRPVPIHSAQTTRTRTRRDAAVADRYEICMKRRAGRRNRSPISARDATSGGDQFFRMKEKIVKVPNAEFVAGANDAARNAYEPRVPGDGPFRRGRPAGAAQRRASNEIAT